MTKVLLVMEQSDTVDTGRSLSHRQQLTGPTRKRSDMISSSSFYGTISHGTRMGRVWDATLFGGT
jgi:hypothetical protein